MDMLPLYIRLGFEHISDLAGYDHILFLVALCAIYTLDQWRILLILVTAFTVGHSATLALTSLGYLTIPSEIIEFLIPATIMATAIHNVVAPTTAARSPNMLRTYDMVTFFGFIHGMGFSNYFRALLMGDDAVLLPLFSFNLGIEIGQLLVVAVIIAAAWLALGVIGVKHREWNLFVSGAAAGMSLILMTETKFW